MRGLIMMVIAFIELAIILIMMLSGIALTGMTFLDALAFGFDNIPVQRLLFILCLYAGSGVMIYAHNTTGK